MDGLQDRIFISFASADQKVARGICGDLEKRGFRCWISSRDVRGGENYQEAIVQAIRGVKVMVLVFTANANGSNEIKKELALASRSNTVVIPLRVENATPSEALDYELATRQWIDAFEDRDEALRTLGERIAGIIATDSEPLPIDSKPLPIPRAETADQLPPNAAQRTQETHKISLLLSQVLKAVPERFGTINTIAAVVAFIVLTATFMGNFLSPTNPTGPTSNIDAVANLSAVEMNAKGDAAQAKGDLSEAFRWYNEAAKKGNAQAQANLGFAYEQGRGVARDYQQAIVWYRKAADEGNWAAQYNLGLLYQQGLGVATDYAQAVSWFRKGAEQGNAAAQASLGYAYHIGQGVAQDYAQAVPWYRKAADQGNAGAQYNLGILYASGTGVPVDQDQARSWMQKAANSGHELAQKWLADHADPSPAINTKKF